MYRICIFIILELLKYDFKKNVGFNVNYILGSLMLVYIFFDEFFFLFWVWFKLFINGVNLNSLKLYVW